LTHDGRRTTDDGRHTTTDDGQPLTTIAHHEHFVLRWAKKHWHIKCVYVYEAGVDVVPRVVCICLQDHSGFIIYKRYYCFKQTVCQHIVLRVYHKYTITIFALDLFLLFFQYAKAVWTTLILEKFTVHLLV